MARAHRSFVFAAAAVLAADCATAPPAPVALTEGPRPEERVAAIAHEVGALVRAQSEAMWLHWTTGAPLSMEPLYRGHEALFSVETIRQVELAAAKAAEPPEARALANLKLYLVGEYLSRGLAEQTEALANLEASMSFTAEGKEHPYRDLLRLLSNERSAARRKALYSGATRAVERLTMSLLRKEAHLRDLVTELGYPSYEACGAELHQVELDSLGALAEQVLTSTQEPYRQMADQQARAELSFGLEKLRRADMPRLFRPRAVDAYFPKDQLLARAKDTLAGLGIELNALAGLTLDLSDGAKKLNRPLSLAVSVPGDVRVSMKLTGGISDQESLFHELGHALHYLYSRPSRFEVPPLGNVTVSESYAFLLEDLTDDPVWLTEQAHLPKEKLAPYLAASSARRLFLLRKAAGSLLFQLARQRLPDAEPKELFRELITRTYGIEVTSDEAARYLVESSDLLEPADDFRAAILAGQLQAQLKARFGPSWWRSAAAGAFLKELWANGNSRSAEEIASQAGEVGLRPDVLVLRLGTTLKAPVAIVEPSRDGGQ